MPGIFNIIDYIETLRWLASGALFDKRYCQRIKDIASIDIASSLPFFDILADENVIDLIQELKTAANNNNINRETIRRCDNIVKRLNAKAKDINSSFVKTATSKPVDLAKYINNVRWANELLWNLANGVPTDRVKTLSFVIRNLNPVKYASKLSEDDIRAVSNIIEDIVNTGLFGNDKILCSISDRIKHIYASLLERKTGMQKKAYYLTREEFVEDEEYNYCPKLTSPNGRMLDNKVPKYYCTHYCSEGKVMPDGSVRCLLREFMNLMEKHEEVFHRLDEHKSPWNKIRKLRIPDGEVEADNASKLLPNNYLSLEGQLDENNRLASKQQEKQKQLLDKQYNLETLLENVKKIDKNYISRKSIDGSIENELEEHRAKNKVDNISLRIPEKHKNTDRKKKIPRITELEHENLSPRSLQAIEAILGSKRSEDNILFNKK